MKKYLGATIVDINDTKFKDYTPSDFAMYFVERYGQIEGDHHRAWVLDQVAQVLKGTKPVIKLAKWDDGESEYRVTLETPSAEYEAWVLEMMGEYDAVDDQYEYDYTQGIAP